MKILSVNAGSSSLKFTAFEMPEEKTLISGYFERIGIGNSFYTIKINGQKKKIEKEMNTHIEAFQILIEELISNDIVKDLSEIKGIGHRVVHGAEKFKESLIITPENLKEIEEFTPLAPLHNPPALIGIRAAMDVVPNAIQVASFDTAFHQTMAKDAYLYAVPYDWYENFALRKYGMHGLSYQYIASKIESILGRKESKVIVCHLGSGASICALKNGKSVDTSMGLTPNAGLIMGTRSGDIDATMLTYLRDKSGLSIEEIFDKLNKESGLLGISGQYSDMRDILAGIKSNDERSALALKMYIRRVVDYIARYYFELKGVDAIVLTAGVGENGYDERRELLHELEFLGVKVDDEINNSVASFLNTQEAKITTEDSSIPVYVIPTNEEIMMARNTFERI